MHYRHSSQTTSIVYNRFMRKPIVAIDGPAGAGKSTVAKAVASKLGYTYIDTGAMYRAVAVKSIEANIPLGDEASIVELSDKLEIRFEQIDGMQHIFAEGDDVTTKIRTPEATRLSSPVSAIAGVRTRLVNIQRQMGNIGGVVMEGRDIGTNVFPDAEVKIFLTASPEERAKRRCKDLAAAGIDADQSVVAEEIRERDERDSTRDLNPLTQAIDAILVDTDGMSIDEVVQKIVDIHDRRIG